MRSIPALLAAAAVFAVAACEYPSAFVHKPREFDRTAPDYRREPSDRTLVTICARTLREPDAAVPALADGECQKHGKRAAEPERRFGVCPLLLASAVVYRCVRPTT